jgi:ParB-like chromosome segregation protein Spo0J
MKICGYEVHPAAELFPMMPDAELKELADDIKEHGLVHRIVLHDGKVLDGRNRLLACDMAGVIPYFKNLNGEHSPTEYALAMNLKRRQLTPSQKATVAAGALSLFEAEAKERQGKRNDIKEKFPESSAGQSRDKAAAVVGVNPRYVSDAKRIKDKSPETFEQVAKGEKTISEAKHELQLSPKRATDEPPNHLSELKSIWRQCTKEQKAEFLKWLQKSGQKLPKK